MECLGRLQERWPWHPRPGNGPHQFGKFLIEQELGRGGHGVVFRALDPTLGRRIALKIPRPEFLDDPDARHRFLREARAVALLDHPGIVPILELGEVGPVCYMASVYCAGPNLAAWLKSRKTLLDPRVAAQLTAEIAQAVGHAHARGVLHRDLKPQNILLEDIPVSDDPAEPGVRLRVTDFGLAKLLDAEAELTRTGVVLGTPRYMAPEQRQARHDLVGPPADVYALGAILAEMLDGRPAAPGSDGALPSRPVPPALRDIVAKCLEPEPGHRYADAVELAYDLERFRNGEPVRARRGRLRRRIGTWAGRRSMTAAGLVALAPLIASAFALPLWTPRRVDRNAPGAEGVRDERGDRQARANRYADDLHLAARLSSNENRNPDVTATVHSLLDRNRPGAGGEDLRSLDWYYLWRRFHGEQATLSGHKGAVFHVVYSPDGTALASAGEDGVRVWDVPGRRLRLTLREHRDFVLWVSFAPDGKRLATASDDHTVAVWSADDGRRLLGPLNHPHKVVSVLFTPDGKRLISGDRGGGVTVWDAQTGRAIQHRQASGGPMEGMALTGDGSVVATATSHEVTLWDLPSLERRLPGIPADPGHSFDGVTFSHDGAGSLRPTGRGTTCGSGTREPARLSGRSSIVPRSG